MANVVVMRGVSGSGKSTFIQRLRERLAKTHTFTVVSMDHYFMQGDTYVFDSAKLSQAAAFCYKQFLLALAGAGANEIVIVDNTNTTAVEISPYVLAAAAFDAPYCIQTLPVPEDLGRNVHGVPVANVLAQAEKFNQPLPRFWQGDQGLWDLLNGAN